MNFKVEDFIFDEKANCIAAKDFDFEVYEKEFTSAMKIKHDSVREKKLSKVYDKYMGVACDILNKSQVESPVNAEISAYRLFPNDMPVDGEGIKPVGIFSFCDLHNWDVACSVVVLEHVESGDYEALFHHSEELFIRHLFPVKGESMRRSRDLDDPMVL